MSGLTKKHLAMRLICLVIIFIAVVFSGAIFAQNVQDSRPRNIIIIMDKSASMLKSDPDRFRIDAAQLAIALAKRTDSIGVVSFSDNADVNSVLQQIKTNANKDVLQESVDSKPEGMRTNFRAPLAKALDMAEKAGKPGYIIFLTDGDHNVGPSEHVDTLIKQISNAGWKVFTIELKEKGADSSSLLKTMGPETGGANFKVLRPSELIKNYLDISQDIQNTMMLETREPMTLKVFPKYRRVVIMEVSEERQILLGPKITIDGTSQELSHNDDNFVYMYPVGKLRERPVHFNITSVERPRPGKWDIGFERGITKAFVLVEPSFEFVIPQDKPRRVYYEGEDVEFALSLQSLSGDIPEELVKNAEIFAVVSRDGEDDKPIHKIQLKYNEAASDKKNMLFDAITDKITVSKHGVPESFNVKIEVAIKDDANPGLVWRHQKSTSFKILPWNGKISVAPKQFETELFDLSGEYKMTFLMESNSDIKEVPVKFVHFATEDKAGATVTIEPAEVTLHAGQEQDVIVRFSKAKPGVMAGRIHVETVGPREQFGIRGAVANYRIVFSPKEIKVNPAQVNFGQVVAGEEASAEFTITTNVPENKKQIEIKAGKLAGEALQVSSDSDVPSKDNPVKVRLKVRIPIDAKPGLHTCEIVVKSEDGLACFVNARVTVTSLVRNVSRSILSFETEAGLAPEKEETFRVTTNSSEKLKLTITVSDLSNKGKIIKGDIIRVSAPKEVSADEPVEAVVSIGQTELVDDGDYYGTITCQVGDLRPFNIEIKLRVIPYNIHFSDNELDFGRALIGETAHGKIKLSCSASRPIKIKIIAGTLVCGNEKLPLPMQDDFFVSKDSDALVELKYTPKVPGNYRGKLICRDDEKSDVFELPLQLIALPPMFENSPTSIYFRVSPGRDPEDYKLVVKSNSKVNTQLDVSLVSAQKIPGELCTKDGRFKMSNVMLNARKYNVTKESPANIIISVKNIMPPFNAGTYSGVFRIVPEYGDILLVPIEVEINPVAIDVSKQELDLGRNVVIGSKVSSGVMFSSNSKVDVPIHILDVYLRKLDEDNRPTGEKISLMFPDENYDYSIRDSKSAGLNVVADTRLFGIGNFVGQIRWEAMGKEQRPVQISISVAAPSFYIDPKLLDFGLFRESDIEKILILKVNSNAKMPAEYYCRVVLSGQDEDGAAIEDKNLPEIIFKDDGENGIVLLSSGSHKVSMVLDRGKKQTAKFSGRIIFTPKDKNSGLPVLEIDVQAECTTKSWLARNWQWLAPSTLILLILVILLIRQLRKKKRS